MYVTNRSQTAREGQRAQSSQEELIERIMRSIRNDGAVEPLQGLWFLRCSSPTELRHSVSFPAFCVVAQGSKEVLLGDRCYRYDPAYYLIATAALPIASRIVEASREAPYLSLTLELDPALVGSVLVEASPVAPRKPATVTAIDVSPLDVGLLDAVVRLVRLVDSPDDARFLAPLLQREIVYRLMQGEQRGRLGQITALGGPTQRIAEAIERLRNNFDQSLCIEDMAHELGMSLSGFHHHFRAITAMSPLQFQKQLRLQEARRLMLGGGMDAATAGYRVGYSNASQFTREYKRLFGAPPMHDVEQLREGASERMVDQGMV
jgi:AraC-like DNA-binding protein